MPIFSEDITYKSGEDIGELDQQNAKWRQVLFQDVQESIDGKFLYFLYDPEADQRDLTTAACKEDPGLTIFDIESCCFTGQVVLPSIGSLKFIFSLGCRSPQGGSSLILVMEKFNHNDNQTQLNIFRLDMTADGRHFAGTYNLLIAPIPVTEKYICSQREEFPEIIVLTGPELRVYRVNSVTPFPMAPIWYDVPAARIDSFYDGFLHNEKVYLLSAYPNGFLNWTQVHILDLNNPISIFTRDCYPDPVADVCPTPRKKCAIAVVKRGVIFAGGEIVSDEQNGKVTRLSDYWMLDLSLLQWKILPDKMPYELIRPHLTVSNFGNIYLWGYYAVTDPNIMALLGTQIRIFKITEIQQPLIYGQF